MLAQVSSLPKRTQRPDVTVVLPTRDRPELLRRAVRSVLQQDLQALEVIVVDDGSSTPAAVALGELLADERLVVVRHEVSQGVSAARNAAVIQARAPWVAFLDDDDVWHPRKLVAQLECAHTEHAGMVQCAAIKTDLASRTSLEPGLPPGPDNLLERLLHRNVVGTPSTVMVATETQRAAGGFDTELSVLADWDMWLRLVQVTRVASVRWPTTGVLAHAGSMQLVDRQRILAEFAHMARRHDAVLARYGLPFPSKETQVWLAGLRWRSEPSLASGVAYASLAVRRGQARYIFEPVLRRRVLQRRHREAPEWARALMTS